MTAFVNLDPVGPICPVFKGVTESQSEEASTRQMSQRLGLCLGQEMIARNSEETASSASMVVRP